MLIRRDRSLPVTLLIGVDLRAPAWSPDGTELAFYGREEPGALYQIGRISFGTAPVDPTDLPTAEQVTWSGDENQNEMNPAWSPDGTRLAFVQDAGVPGNGDNDIWTAALDLTTQHQLTGDSDGGTGVEDAKPGWSRDGSQIVFHRAVEGGGTHLWLMSADGSGEVDLMEARAGTNEDPSWR